jgi:hypothetical protein
MSTLRPASAEQQAVIEAAGRSNVIVDSVAGSGKTTTVLHIAKTYPLESILLLTFNSKLRQETQARARMLGLNNLEAHTYHSFGYRYISGEKCRTDEGLIEFIASGKPLFESTNGANGTDGTNGANDTIYEDDYDESPITRYTTIIIDECQDMKPLLYKLVMKITNVCHAKMIIVGDKNQSIYGYAGADPRFIMSADFIFASANNLPWERHVLSTTYRCTQQMVELINHVLGAPRMKAIKQGPKPNYTICDMFTPYDVINEIKGILRNNKPEDIFVIAPSVKSIIVTTEKSKKNPIAKVANGLTQLGIKIYIPTSDESKLDDELMSGKIVFSSFHQTKGLERKYVIVLGFDDTYFKFYNKDDPSDKCPNILYVALTRAQVGLSIYHNQKSQPVKFIDLDQIRKLSNFKGSVKQAKLHVAELNDRTVAVSKLTEHITSEVMSQCMQLIDWVSIRQPGKLINIPLKTKQTKNNNTHHEEVSDINGVAIPFYYEYKKTGKISVFETLPLANLEPAQLLEMANKYLSQRHGLMFKYNQIHDYNWLTKNILNAAYIRTSRELDRYRQKEFEVKLEYDIQGWKLLGAIDVKCDKIIELKTVGRLLPEHYIQTAIYGYIHGRVYTPKVCHLFNIRTDELIEITIDPEKISKMIRLLICGKFHKRKATTDEQFFASIGLAACQQPTCDECKAELLKEAEEEELLNQFIGEM